MQDLGFVQNAALFGQPQQVALLTFQPQGKRLLGLHLWSEARFLQGLSAVIFLHARSAIKTRLRSESFSFVYEFSPASDVARRRAYRGDMARYAATFALCSDKLVAKRVDPSAFATKYR